MFVSSRKRRVSVKRWHTTSETFGGLLIGHVNGRQPVRAPRQLRNGPGDNRQRVHHRPSAMRSAIRQLLRLKLGEADIIKMQVRTVGPVATLDVH